MSYDIQTEGFPRLETERFILRQMTMEDADAMFRYFSDEEVVRYYDLEPLSHVEQAREMIESKLEEFQTNQGIRWAICRREDETRMLGSCGYHAWSKGDYKAEVGFELAREHWGLGIMTEVMQAVIRYGFEQMRLNRIFALTDTENMASQRVLTNLHFRREGTLRDSMFVRGEFRDEAVFSLLQREWAKEVRK